MQCSERLALELLADALMSLHDANGFELTGGRLSCRMREDIVDFAVVI